MTAPDMRGRLKRLRARGGKLVVIDPRRSATAMAADEHHFIRPGTDALLLFALVNVLFEEGLTQIDERIAAITTGIETVAALCEPFTPEAVAPATCIDAADVRRVARELAQAPTAAVYGRIGTCTQEFGATASWLVDVLNVLTGNLDREGGAMFPMGAAGHSNAVGPAGVGRGARFGRFTSRVRQLPEIFGELPVACLAEEIETPGEGQVKALITVSGNPLVSTPNSERLSGRARAARADDQHRRVRQRDDPPRRRDPAGTLAAAPLALRPRAVPVRGSQRRQLLAAGAGTRPGASPTSGSRC